MITVTNGTVSRTYKVGDYEPRVVSLSFNVDPGSDVESLVADVVSMVERLARQTPKRRLTGDELVGEAHNNAPDEANLTWVARPVANRKPRLDKDPNDPLPPAMAAPIEAAPTPVSVSAPEPEPVVLVTPTYEGEEGLRILVASARAAVARVGADNHYQVQAVVNQFLAEPNARLRSMAEDKRAAAIAALAELGKSSEY